MAIRRYTPTRLGRPPPPARSPVTLPTPSVISTRSISTPRHQTRNTLNVRIDTSPAEAATPGAGSRSAPGRRVVRPTTTTTPDGEARTIGHARRRLTPSRPAPQRRPHPTASGPAHNTNGGRTARTRPRRPHPTASGPAHNTYSDRTARARPPHPTAGPLIPLTRAPPDATPATGSQRRLTAATPRRRTPAGPHNACDRTDRNFPNPAAGPPTLVAPASGCPAVPPDQAAYGGHAEVDRSRPAARPARAANAPSRVDRRAERRRRTGREGHRAISGRGQRNRAASWWLRGEHFADSCRIRVDRGLAAEHHGRHGFVALGR